jgi:hypothetical protein
MPINNANRTIATLLVTQGIMYVTNLMLIRKLAKQKLQYEKLCEMTGYLANMLEENGIELSEFDVIALSTITGEHNATK